jgi:ribosomal protein L17
MRHKDNKLIEMRLGEYQTRSNVVRTMLTNFVREGHMTTTSKKAKVLKSEADTFFGNLLKMFDIYKDEADVRREAIRYVKSMIFGEVEGKKVVNEILPTLRKTGKRSGFVASYKLGYRAGDGAEKILLRLI